MISKEREKVRRKKRGRKAKAEKKEEEEVRRRKEGEKEAEAEKNCLRAFANSESIASRARRYACRHPILLIVVVITSFNAVVVIVVIIILNVVVRNFVKATFVHLSNRYSCTDQPKRELECNCQTDGARGNVVWICLYHGR